MLSIPCVRSDYADPDRPDCTTDEDGVTCEDEAAESCASELGFSIQTIDRSVHVKRVFNLPVHAADMADEEKKALLADMFYRDAMPAVVFTTGIETHRCDDPANAEVPACTAQEQGRRRLQLGAGSCPHATFLSKAAAMKTTCGLEAGAAALPPSCASTDCARQLLSLLNDCTESIDRATGEGADFYAALEGSALYAACVELDQSAATFAAVKVEFRAPSRLVADRLIAEHEKLAADMATVFTAGCAAPPAGACDGRRQLEHCEQAVDEIAALRAQLRRVTDERAAAVGERDAAVGELQRVAGELEAAVGELGTVIGERDTLLETVIEQGAFKVSGRQEVSKNFSGVETASAVGVRQQATSSTPEPKWLRLWSLQVRKDQFSTLRTVAAFSADLRLFGLCVWGSGFWVCDFMFCIFGGLQVCPDSSR